jgi:dihydrofolate reductase
LRKLIASLFASVDGFASDAPDEEMRWIQSLDTLVLGRVTYETMAARDDGFAELMNGIQKVVFSNTLREEDITWANTRLAKCDLADEITSLKHQLGRDIGISGSVALVRALMKLGLIDRLRLQVHPVVLGPAGGKPIFDGYDETDLELVETRVLDGRVVVLDYRPRGSR